MSEGTNSTALTTTGAQGAISNLNSGVSALFSSITAETVEEKMQVLDYVTNPEAIADHLGETLNLRHVIAQAVDIADENTGETTEAIRIILVTEEGQAYSAVSKGLFTYLRNLFDIVGHPSSWEKPLPIKVVEKRGRGKFRFMTVELASASKSAPAAK